LHNLLLFQESSAFSKGLLTLARRTLVLPARFENSGDIQGTEKQLCTNHKLNQTEFGVNCFQSFS